ncbi:hypothetical protein CH330_01420 [candidate division WOR-3 bacterium JGI_Cruoil_03_51_56]|uniref:Uncharacterized protein n=1 Tax=candidate division WOR-3 bacterium JGI_Cruoil_03_51_56 TaxID=1973747 RepID=A0A235BXM4_UNCW3|nr:MAG: hypothetical protein CH330_01420 [candidate division WOR-3 bacterium JGI_Cruoil_03_51_56]
MVQYGLRVAGQAQPKTGILQVGKTYEVHVQTTTIRDPEDVAAFVLNRFKNEYPELQINWIQVGTQTINFQFTMVSRGELGLTPRPISLTAATIIVWLPTILTLIGLVAIVISLYSIIQAVPWYIWGTLIFGVVILIWGPSLIQNSYKI